MNRTTLTATLASLLGLAIFSDVPAQTATLGGADDTINNGMPPATLDRPLSAGVPRLELTAGNENDRAVLSLGNEIASQWQWGLTLSSPWNEDGPSEIATLDGLARGFKAEISLSHTFFDPATRLSAAAASRDTSVITNLQSACDAARASVTPAVAAAIAAAAGEAAAPCDDRLYDEVTDRAVRRQIYAAYFGGKPIVAGSLTASVATDKFKHLDATFEEQEKNETSWAAGVDLAILNPVTNWSVLLGYRREHAFADATDSKATICEPIEDRPGAEKCKEGFLDPAVAEDKDIATAEYRKKISESIALALTVSRDFEDDVTGVDLPIYMVKSPKGALTGGLRFGWRDDTNDLTAGIFVTTDFSLLN